MRIEIASGEGYPRGLHDADGFVPVICPRGERTLLDAGLRMAVIGSHEAPGHASHARRLAREPVRAGVTVVSGVARGIDVAVHRAAIAAGGRAIAVLGTSVLDTCPPEHRALQDEISEAHLLVSRVLILRSADRDRTRNRQLFRARRDDVRAERRHGGRRGGRALRDARAGTRAAPSRERALYVLQSCFADRLPEWPARCERAGAGRFQSVRQPIELPTRSG